MTLELPEGERPEEGERPRGLPALAPEIIHAIGQAIREEQEEHEQARQERGKAFWIGVAVGALLAGVVWLVFSI